jgi:hypothetical protein
MENNHLIMETPIRMARNCFGIKVKMCCASCKMRKILSEKGRICGLSGEPVAGSHYCQRWEMNRRLQNAGMSGGQIKSWRYLTYYRERWIRQREDFFARRIRPSELLSAKNFRKEFEKEHGSIYVNF